MKISHTHVSSLFTLLILFAIAAVTAYHGQSSANELIIENANLEFVQCMQDAPVVESNSTCHDSNHGWAVWLSQYLNSKAHTYQCIRKFGGIDYHYYYKHTDNNKAFTSSH